MEQYRLPLSALPVFILLTTMSPTAILRKVSNKASKLMRARTCRLVAIVILASLACWAVATGYQATISQRGPNSRSDARDERWPAQTLRRGTPYDSQARYEVINHLLKEKRTVWLPWKVGGFIFSGLFCILGLRVHD